MNFSVVTRIVGVDRLSEVAARAGASLKRLTAPAKAFRDQLGKTDSSALGKVGLVADGVAGKFSGLLGRVSAFVPALGVITGASTLAGLFGMAKGWAEASVETANLATQIGITTGQLGAFRYAAKSGRVETEVMDKSLAKLNKTLYDAATGKNADVAALFAKLNIRMRDAKGNVRNVADVMPELAEAFRRNENPAVRAAMATALFGDEGAKLIAILIGGRAAFDAAAADAKRFGSLTVEQAASARKLDKAFIGLDKATSAFSARISAAVAPRLTMVIERIIDWTAANRELVGQAIERKLDGIERFVTKVGKAFDFLVSIPAVRWLLKSVDASTALDIALIAISGTIAGPVLHMLGVVTASIWRMNAALWANPYLLVAAAAAAAAYVIYDNWGNIDTYFENKMSRVRKAMDRGWADGMLEILREFNPVTLTADALDGLSKYLFDFDLYDAGKRLIQRLIDGAKSLLPSLEEILEPIRKVERWLGRAAAAVPTVGPIARPGSLPAPSGGSAIVGNGSNGRVPVDVQGGVKVDISISGAPPGTRTDAKDSGMASANVRVGPSHTD